MKDFFFRVIRLLNRKLIAWSKDPRPSSRPFLSGDSFRAAADHVYDEISIFDPIKVKPGDIVFLKADLIEKYFLHVHPKISNRYKLVTHNSDRNIGDKEISHLDEKILVWFAQNLEVFHPRLVPLPIGLENKHYYFNGIPRLFNKIRKKKKVSKKNRILFGFNVATNPRERMPALQAMESLPVAEKIKGFPIPPTYLKTLNNYKFVAAPPGNGIDCHRAWEAMYLKTVPIVKKSISMEYFKEIGVPLFMINDWMELANIDENRLNEIYEDIQTRGKTETLEFDYWLNKIKDAG